MGGGRMLRLEGRGACGFSACVSNVVHVVRFAVVFGTAPPKNSEP